MKYSIGYQLPDEYYSTYELCQRYAENVSDVYFSYSDEPSGRFALKGDTDEETRDIAALQLEELGEIKRLGKSLTLLYNANCYGSAAVSDRLKGHVIERTTFLKKRLDIDKITTTSPFIAEVIKKEFGDSITVVASVNMRIGSVAAMEQLASCFDGYYIKKECNRNFGQIETLKKWCDANNKSLHLLANSGCMTDCAFQTFHDNLIAHSVGENSDDSVNMGFAAPCHKYLSDLGVEKGITKFLQSNFIRPEEVHLYEKYFTEMKLATRMHQRPQMVVAAYIRGRFSGNLLDITEPSYSVLFKGHLLDNTKLPKEWVNAAYGCNKNCRECTACGNAVRQAVYKIDQQF